MHADTLYLHEILLFLGAATILVPLFRHVKINPVLGYLIVGMVIGPYGIHKILPDHPFAQIFTISEYEHVKPLAEWGIIFLLFIIGLELSFKRLWLMRALIFGLGTAQVVLSALAIGIIVWLWGNGVYAAVLIGAGLALSSTAVVTKILFDNRDFATPAGQAGFSVLLMQDLAVVPLLVFIGVLGTGGPESGLSGSLPAGFFKACAVIAAIVVLGRFVLRPVYRHVTRSGSAELFTALTLLIVIGTALATGQAGMGMALGAFLAGLILAETEYRHQIEADIEPFEGLLLGLFFMSVGMGINIAAVADILGLALLSVLGLFIIKSALLTLLGLAFGLGLKVALQTGIMLGHAGEFAFVILSLAFAQGMIPEETHHFMLTVTSLSLLSAPFQYALACRLARLIPASPEDTPHHAAPAEKDHVIIAGFGRAGRLIAAMLKAQNIPFVGVDYDSDLPGHLRREGFPVFFGDARKETVLRHLNTSEARALLVIINDPPAALDIVENARRLCPHLRIYARAADPQHARDLTQAGADSIILETVEMSLQLGGRVLQDYNVPLENIEDILKAGRAEAA